MSVNSLTSEFSLGIQADKTTAATAFKTARAKVSGVNIEWDTRESPLEHPSSVARSTAVKVPDIRTSYKVPIESTFLLYPTFIGTCLRGLGLGVSTVDNTTHYTHTFTIALDSAMAWLTAIHKMYGTSGNLERKIVGCRLSSLSGNIGLDETEIQIAGMGLTEGDATGSETKVAETAVEMRPTTITPVIGGTTSTMPVNDSHTFEIANTLREDQRQVYSSARVALDRQSFGMTGTITGIDADYSTAGAVFYEWYRLTHRNTLVATAPSLTPATGSMAFAFASASNISGAAVPYSLTFTLPSVNWTLSNFVSSADDIVRYDATYKMVDNVATPLTVVLVNSTAAYA